MHFDVRRRDACETFVSDSIYMSGMRADQIFKLPKLPKHGALMQKSVSTNQGKYHVIVAEGVVVNTCSTSRPCPANYSSFLCID